jgi:hypothetical protein
MKHLLYIIAFGFFGLLIATLIHAGVETVALNIIFENPNRFFDTFWWQNWDILHNTGALLLWLLGLFTGFYLGAVWWKPY